jgi:hypothetical protein
MSCVKKPAPIPFDFVLEQLEGCSPQIRAMFGCHAIYVGEKIVLMLRNKESHRNDNGVWVAVRPEDLESLKKVFPSLRPVRLLGERATAWQNIPMESDDFEESVLTVCDLINRQDPRIGKVPKSRKAKRNAAKKR